MLGIVIVFFLSAFSALWCIACYLCSFLSGWMKLSNTFYADRPFTGERCRFCSASMRRHIRYGNILEIGCETEGLHLSLFGPFRISSPRLKIPWSEVVIGTPEKYLGFLTVTRLTLGNEDRIPLAVSTGRARRMLESWRERAASIKNG